jgi:alpha-N-arabinofuranosidase
MRAEYYADEFRRFGTFLGSYEKAALFRIATGPGVDDFHWTEVMMRECAAPRFNPGIMDGLSLHYYMNGFTPPAKAPRAMATTNFGDDDWNRVMAHGWFLDELLTKHSAIMDRHDPARRVGLVVDEWGAWYLNDSGRPASELYQQQTIRDAVLAALTLNLFIAHAERVHMANLAQLANVLHAVLLTFGEKMVRTPSWHVFDLYQPHQDALRLPVTGDSAMCPHEDGAYPRVSATASRAADGSVTVTLAHTNPTNSATVELTLEGLPSEASAKEGKILVAPKLTAVNTPDAPNQVAAQPWTDFSFDGTKFTATLPPGCVAAVSFK